MLPQIRISPLKEALLVWASAFLLLLASSLLFGQGIFSKLLATLSFLLLPRAASSLFYPHNKTTPRPDFGLHLQYWKTELRLFLLLFLPILLLFPLLYAAWLQFQYLLPFLPYASPIEWQWHFQLPPRFGEWVIDQYLVVALSEEYFYRGYLQSRLHEAWPGKTKLLGPGLWLTALLFALGHLANFEFARLSVFFPALLFGFAREKTQGLLCPVLLHGSCNLLLMVLQASFVQT